MCLLLCRHYRQSIWCSSRMPFIDPVETTRNLARYRNVESTDDFLLQEHRYSLRKSRQHWARIVTRSTKPTIKVAETVRVSDARKREWRYVKEDLGTGMPLELQGLPPGNDERMQWLLDKLMTVKRLLPDADLVESDDWGEETNVQDDEEEVSENRILLICSCLSKLRAKPWP